MISTPYPTLNGVFASKPPEWLFHYTSPAALIGVCENRELWATDFRFLNDTKEIGHAVDYAVNAIDNRRGAGSLGTIKLDDELELLSDMIRAVRGAGLAIFVTSFTEHSDQLSQWRAYCPPQGGFALGLKADHLSNVACAQGFKLAPCVYDHVTQANVTLELVDWHVGVYRFRVSSEEPRDQVRSEVALSFAREVQRYGVLLKHRSFHEEAEWRVFSDPVYLNDAGIKFRPGSGRVVPYKVLKLEMEASRLAHVRGMVGPTSDYAAAAWGMQSLLQTRFPAAEVSMGRAEAPYRTW